MLGQLAYELGRGFAYRRISHSEMRTYTTWLPLILTAIIILVYIVLPVKPAFIGPDGLTSILLTLVSILPGFYFAGLAAVATFSSATMDREMPDPAPEVDILVAGKNVPIKLTRRLFLCYLFSYLVLLSFGLCFALIAVNAIAGSFDSLETTIECYLGSAWPWFAMQGVLGSCLVFAFASMIVSTLHGVFFLTEKIHQP